MIRLATFFAFALLWGAAAAAAPDKPSRAPAGDWVVKIPIPASDPAKAAAPVQALLLTTQGRFDPAGDEEYVEYATLVQNPQGLAALGTLAFPWQPDQMDLVIHKLQILRGTQVIDLLANGQDFTVLRRENNLEAATLDGILTAVIQPEGLAVGDIIDVALTYRRRPGAVPFRSESLVPFVAGGRVRRAFVRQVWPDGVEVKWRATPMMGHPQVKSTRFGKELVIDLKDAEAPAAPTDAPPRFSFPENIEASAYGSWSEISRLMNPLYVTASTLPADSPVKAEIARIASGSADPTRRMMAALRLVQDRIRYVAIAMGDGGYTPAPANQTWARKFGDCKGKTALLMALLQGLGIEAEPVLVNSQLGDGLDQQLPMARLFDHVIVRAKIGDKTYWLDGTRSGDRDADDLLSSPLGFGLPLEAAGAELVRLPLLPPRQPQIEVETVYDASKGFEQRVPFSGHVTYRGDLATAWRAALAESGPEKLGDKLKDQVPRIDNDDIKIGSITADEETNRFTFAFSGSTRMDWEDVRSSGARQFRFDDHGIKWEAKFERPAGPMHDVPFQLPFPSYDASREVVALPGNGSGYTLQGTDLDRTVANTEISRHLSLAGGKAVAETHFRRLKPEVSAADAKAAVPILALVNSDAAWIRTPPNYETSAAERQALLAEEPKSASDFVIHGFNLMRDGRYERAIADFD
ncbi:MAG: hypothetical protein QOH86_1967, partial [Sphingomonadales bacterium]|nr:hypothetical protein [Sphingomonadales bacterium]